MGYAHGYLLAPEIVEMVEKYVIEERYDNDPVLYNETLSRVDDLSYFDPDTYGAELQGMLDGMISNAADLSLDVMGRDVNLLDLEVLNWLSSYGDEGQGEIEIEGPIESFPSTPGYIGTWIVAGQAFETDAGTHIIGTPAIGLEARVDVLIPLGGDLLIATKIKIQGEHGTDIEIEGRIESFPPTPGYIGTWIVAGQEFETDADTDVRDTPTVGRSVKVRASLRPGRQLPRATEVEGQEGCSSFSAWDGAAVGGGTLAARNLDWRYDTKEGIAATYGLLITYDSDDPQVNDFVAVAWPGVIGAPTSFNEHGVLLAANYGNGLRQATGTDYVSANLIAREAIETADGVDPVGDVLNVVLNTHRSGSQILLVAYPSSGSGQDGAQVIEYDAYGATIRESDYDFPDYEHIVATNHFIERYTPYQPWPSSVARYDGMASDLLYYYGTDDQVVDSSEAEEILKGAVGPTLHSVIAHPDDGSYAVYFADVKGHDPVQFEAAPYAPSASYSQVIPETHQWTDLFSDGSNHGDFSPFAELSHGPVVGAVTSSSARIFVRTSLDASVSVEFCTEPGLGGQCKQTASQPTVLAGDYTAQIPLDSLSPSTTYYYDILVDGSSQLAEPYPQFTTFPQEGTSVDFKVVVLNDFFTTYFPGAPQVDTFASASAESPDLVIIGGDFDHRDPRSQSEKRQMFKAVYSAGASGFPDQILDKYPLAHVWDDHDYGENNAYKDYAYKALSLEVLREYFPLYPTSDHGAWQKFTYGQTEFFMLDTRSQRDPNWQTDGPDKSMLDGDDLGSVGQLDWLKNGLLSSSATWKIIYTPSVFNPTSGKDDSWSGFQHERQDILDFIGANNITGAILVAGDMHFGAIDDGTNSGLPEMEVPSVDLPWCLSWTDTGTWSEGTTYQATQIPCMGYGALTFQTDPDEVLLEVKDDQGQTQISYVLTTEPTPSTVHVANIDMSLIARRSRRRAQADILIHDQDGSPVSGALVSGEWSGVTSRSSSDETDSGGIASLLSRWTSKHGTFTISVTDVAVPGYTYDPAANQETSDSISW